jgi:hypothetical protein
MDMLVTRLGCNQSSVDTKLSGDISAKSDELTRLGIVTNLTSPYYNVGGDLTNQVIRVKALLESIESWYETMGNLLTKQYALYLGTFFSNDTKYGGGLQSMATSRENQVRSAANSLSKEGKQLISTLPYSGSDWLSKKKMSNFVECEKSIRTMLQPLLGDEPTGNDKLPIKESKIDYYLDSANLLQAYIQWGLGKANASLIDGNLFAVGGGVKRGYKSGIVYDGDAEVVSGTTIFNVRSLDAVEGYLKIKYYPAGSVNVAGAVSGNIIYGEDDINDRFIANIDGDDINLTFTETTFKSTGQKSYVAIIELETDIEHIAINLATNIPASAFIGNRAEILTCELVDGFLTLPNPNKKSNLIPLMYSVQREGLVDGTGICKDYECALALLGEWYNFRKSKDPSVYTEEKLFFPGPDDIPDELSNYNYLITQSDDGKSVVNKLDPFLLSTWMNLDEVFPLVEKYKLESLWSRSYIKFQDMARLLLVDDEFIHFKCDTINC